MQNSTLPSLSECLVFFDFDNTITNFDVLDDIIRRFSADKKWVAMSGPGKKGKSAHAPV